MGQVMEGHEGNPIGATDDNQMKISGPTYAENHESAMVGDAYTMDIDGITSAVDEHWLLALKNTHASDNLVVTRIYILPNQAKDDQQIRVYLGGTFVYLAEGTAVVPTNLRSGITGGASGDFYVSDGSGDIMTTIVAGSVAARYPVPSRVPYDLREHAGWVVPPQQCFMLRPTKDSKFYGFISFYYHCSHV